MHVITAGGCHDPIAPSRRSCPYVELTAQTPLPTKCVLVLVTPVSGDTVLPRILYVIQQPELHDTDRTANTGHVPPPRSCPNMNHAQIRCDREPCPKRAAHPKASQQTQSPHPHPSLSPYRSVLIPHPVVTAASRTRFCVNLQQTWTSLVTGCDDSRASARTLTA